MAMIVSPRRTLVLGGARSGKSAYAERAAEALAHTAAPGAEPRLIYIATAEAWDQEMTDRIAEHRARRGSHWRTVDAPHALSPAIADQTAPDAILLVDCLTLWLSNRLLAEADLDAESAELVAALSAAAGPVFCVSNEVGLGVVPDNALARRFRDAQGRLNQAVAAASDHVLFLAAGLPLTLKSPK